MAVNTDCVITNSSGSDLVVLDAYNHATNVGENSSKQGYEQDLKILAVQEGGKIIKDGASGTVTLDDTRQEGDETKPNYMYQLLISDPTSLFPIMDASVDLCFSTESYPPVEVTADSAAQMKLGLTFVQSIMAYPTSSLATGFSNAMEEAQKQDSIDDMNKVIAAFFATTQNYQSLDLATYVSVSSYLTAFASYWGLGDGGSLGRTYWCYGVSSDGSKASTMGKITFTRQSDAPTPADPTDRCGGYNIMFTAETGFIFSGGASVPAVYLTIDGGQFLDKDNPDTPTVAVMGSFALKSTFTGVATDTTVWPILVGKIGGTQCLAVSMEPDSDAWSWFQKHILDLDPESFDSWMTLLLKVVGLWMGYDFIKTKTWGKKNKLEDDRVNENNGAAPDEDQQAQANDAADQMGNNALDENRSVLERAGGQRNSVPDDSDLASYRNDLKEELVQNANNRAAENYNNAIEEYQAQAEELGKIQMNDDLQDAYESLLEASNAMDAAKASGDFSTVKTSLDSASVSLSNAVKEMDISDGLQQEINASNEAVEDYRAAAEAEEDNSKEIEDGDDPIDPEIKT